MTNKLVSTKSLVVKQVSARKLKNNVPENLLKLLEGKVAESSQSAVAREAGIPLFTIQRCLKGIGEPSSDTLKRFADYFKVSVAWLRGENDDKLAWMDKTDWVGQVPMVFEGERLRKVRETLGYSLEEMAQQLDINLSLIKEYEQEVFISSIWIFRKLAQLSININWILTGSGIIRLKETPAIISNNKVTYIIDNLFSTRLKRRLGAKSTEWLSKETSISIYRIENIVADRTIPLVCEVEKIAEVLGVAPHWLAEKSKISRENWEYEYYREYSNDLLRDEIYKIYENAVKEHLVGKYDGFSVKLSAESTAHVIKVACRIHMKDSPDSREADKEMVHELIKLARKDKKATD